MSDFHKPKEYISEEQKRWDNMVKEVDALEDRLGEPIDESIKETVVAFRLYDFPTNQSCEGHDDHGVPYPWVLVQSEPPQGWEEDIELQQQWLKKNKSHAERMQKLLRDFYADREVEDKLKLRLVAQGVFGAFRLQSVEFDEEGRKEYLQLRKEEMSQFTQYLKIKFLHAKN